MAGRRAGRAWLLADAAWRLGPRACALYAWHRLRLRAGLARQALEGAAWPDGRALPEAVPMGSAGPARAVALARQAEGLVAEGWHGPFDAYVHALDLDLFAPGDIRPVWERNRLLALPLLALAARCDPAGGHLARAEALFADWRAANRPFLGPAWACGQEAALRALHLCLALALLEADRAPSKAMRAVLAAHAQRIAATRAYAAAQDNNHAVSEPAALFVLGLVLGDAALVRRGARGLARAVARLVAADGAFAQASPGYHRLLLDTLAIAEWFRRRHAAPEFPAPFAARARAATLWLHRVAAPGGALPRAGAGDDSALGDLSLGGPLDARGSLERAARLFCEASAGRRDDPGCAALGLACPEALLRGTDAWRSEGWMGESRGALRVLLRSGAPLRFRPAQADLLHIDLWHGDDAVLRDGGTGAYNPPPGCAWWTEALAATAAHNTIEFDGASQMPRLSRFLYARWPRCRAVPGGAALRDASGRRHERRFRLEEARLTVEDRIAGPFARAVLRWRLAPGAWRVAQDGAESAGLRVAVSADAPCRIRLAQGWESPAYGVVAPAPVLECVVAAPASRLVTVVELR
ncbi:heparinase [Roseomonas eburnea]|uniref:Heparinase n=2 Tax=Neoroseomonas eburnea TaxID=1346889 RepID=A0A9X9XK78_9PROT|nr:heparinase II/III-family protein [Neoroseomonas eburnea]MBR0684114.1 heparinase [Neoroseomonas eburnea]